MHDNHLEFMAWASQYDDGDESMRSLRFHEQWLERLHCPVLRLNGELKTEKQVEEVIVHMQNFTVTSAAQLVFASDKSL